MGETFKRSKIRDILVAAGTPEENIETAVSEIFKPHIAVTDALKGQIDDLEARAGAADKLKTELANVKTELAALKEEDYKTKYEAEKANGEKIKTEYETYKTEQGKKAARAAKETAYKGVLKDANIPEKHWTKIIKYSDIDGIELTDDGEPKNRKELLDSVKKEWEEYTKTTTTSGTPTPTPPANVGGKEAMTKEKIMEIKNTAERQAKIAEYPELFGIKTD